MPPVGRDDLLAHAWRQLRGPGSVVLTGPVGVGKSTVVEALAQRAEQAGHRLLRCAPAPADQHLPYLALIDLLSQVAEDSECWRALADPWRRALAAVRRGGGTGVDRSRQLAIRLATLQLLRLLARSGPVLLVIDGLQWVDQPSAEVLEFVARRCHGLPVRAVGAERVGCDPASVAHGLALCPPPVQELGVPPLPAPELARLLREAGVELAAGLMLRVHAASGGNPWFALEIARTLRRLPHPPPAGEPLPVPDRLRALVNDRLTGLSRPVRQALLLVAAASRPSLALLRRAGRERAAAELASARASGILTADRAGIIRFTHPLLAAAVYAGASAAQRRRVHARLSTAVDDPVERVRHRGLAARGPDESIAASLMRAASVARRRGAPGLAAELALLAADRTPTPARAVNRRLRAAADALAAGRGDQARQAAESVLAVATGRRARVQAQLVILDAAGQALAHADQLITGALAAAGGDPGLQAQIRIRVVGKALLEGQLSRAHAEARHCCELADRAADRGTLLRALCLQATAELAMGLPGATGTLRRAQSIAPAGRASPLYQGPAHLLARSHLIQDRFEAARTQLLPLVARAEAWGQAEDLVGLLCNLAELELRAGRCAAALAAARRALALVRDADLSAGPCLSMVALAEATGGDPARARMLAEGGVRRSEADGDRFFLPRNLHALGYAALVEGDAATAAQALRRVAAIEATMGEVDPALFRWHADLAEALVANRELAAAAEVVGRARQAARRRGRRSVLAALARAEALCALADRRPEVAVGQLQAAAADLVLLPVEHGRTLYALGVAERRRRRHGAARAAFQAALAIFDRVGAHPWARRIRAELTHTEPVAGAGLSTIEHRIAQLVRAGASNQQVAAALSVSVKTVESYLTRIYRKLRVRSRAELAGSLAAGDIKGFP